MTASVAHRFLRAVRREPVDRTPVWFMRQAGRYLPEYRQVRGDRDILEAVRTPEVAVEITLQPLRRMPLDAAILFSDIMVPLAAVGAGGGVEIRQGTGPLVAHPLTGRRDVDAIRPLEPEADVPYVLEAVRLLRKELTVPLIGFAGAPFTLASYLVEGGPSRNQERTKAFMLGEPAAWGALMDRLADLTIAYLRAQVAAGAQAVQVFDSWVGALDGDDYRAAVAPATARVFAALRELDVPAIHFGVGTGELLGAMREVGGDVIGIDWRVPLDAGWERVGSDRGVQGNLDPAACVGPWEPLRERTLRVLQRANGRDGHVFNLGHGVLPQTPVENLQRVVDLVHETTERVDA